LHWDTGEYSYFRLPTICRALKTRNDDTLTLAAELMDTTAGSYCVHFFARWLRCRPTQAGFRAVARKPGEVIGLRIDQVGVGGQVH
jgi:hypothetical protein